MSKKQIKIAFLGSDGSGKTTLIEYLNLHLQGSGKNVKIVTFGWKNFSNPLIKIISNFYLNSKFKRQEKDRLERFRKRSLMFYLLYYFELLTRYFKLYNSKEDFILFDRYFYEELMFMKGIQFKIFKKLTPVPNFCFVLKPTIAGLKKRGHLVSKENFNNFYSHLEKLKEHFPVIVLDSSKSVEELGWEVMYRQRTYVLGKTEK